MNLLRVIEHKRERWRVSTTAKELLVCHSNAAYESLECMQLELIAYLSRECENSILFLGDAPVDLPCLANLVCSHSLGPILSSTILYLGVALSVNRTIGARGSLDS